ncbi:uncharacterized protein Triagg1_430 [Trichoderma aggressivum f. europaeum]|uniref:RING-type domain-containing protein n=1 Tax=Trichoderma aggressivum f. europaeum TaxID=173218 RepID=A0AAE1ILY9_9HYPO|nr:hypothetical protein Triagg1_430 [Trichoderma aggressivum f. europaeum]
MEPHTFAPISHPDQYFYGPTDWRRELGHHTPVHPPWAPNQVPVPHGYGMHRPYAVGFDSQLQMGPPGGLPVPGSAPRSYQPYSHPISMPHARPWPEGFSQMPVPVPVPVQPNPLAVMQYSQPGLYPRQTSENELGQGQSGVALESDAQTHIAYPPQHHPVPPMNQFPGSLSTPLQTSPIPLQSARRLGYHSVSGIPPRVSRAPLSPLHGPPPYYADPSGPPPYTHRRPGHSRARRSANSRLTAADMNRDIEDNGTLDASGPRSDRDRVVNPLQVAAGTATGATTTTEQRTHTLAEKMTVKIWRSLLQKVELQDLPENERTCVICYNDYGAKTPEGINEEPLRLPKCKHVFGNHCLARWFEDSDNCPYCRDKLELPPKHSDRVVSQFFTAMMSARHQLPPGPTEEMYLRFMSNLVTAEGLGGSQEQELAMERRPFHATGDSDSSSYDGEAVSSASSLAATSTSPIRNAQRDNARHSQWLPRVPQQRGAHPPTSQERETSRHRRYRSSRGNTWSVTANADSDPLEPTLSPLQAQSHDATPSSLTIPAANGESSEGSRNAADLQTQSANMAVASAVQSRIRPW